MEHKINKSMIEKILLFLILFFVMIPKGIKFFWDESLASFLLSFGCIISFIITIILLISSKKIKILDYKMSIIIFIFRFTLLIFAIFISGQRSDISEQIKYLLAITSLTVSCEFFISKNRLSDYVKVIILLYSFYIIINFVLMLIFPDGIIISKNYTINQLAYNEIQNHFLGFRNEFVFQLLPILSIIFINRGVLNKKSKISIILQLIIIISIFMSRSSTAIMAIVVFYLSEFVVKYLNKKIKIKISYIIILYILLVLIVVFFDGGEIFRVGISEIFNKNASLTGRTEIWDLAKEMILKSPIYGYGNDDAIIFLGSYWYAHNGILDLLIQGGIIALAMYIYICRITLNSVSKSKNSSLYAVTVPIVMGFSVIMFTESCVNFSLLLYVVFVILYHLGSNENKKEENNENRESIKK